MASRNASNPRQRPHQRPINAVLACVLLAALAIRASTLGNQSFWFDEGWSWHLARMPWPEMVDITAGDRSPIGYYTLLGLWLRLGGDSEFALRLPSTLADVCSTALLAAFARMLQPRPRWLAVLPAALWSISPMGIWYAQEARMYALVGALGLGSSWMLWRWVEGMRRSNPPRIHTLLLSSTLLAAALHTHYYAIFLLPAQALAVLALSLGTRNAWPTLRRYALSVLAVLAMVIPWLIYAQGGFGYSDGFIAPVNTIDGRFMEFIQTIVTGGFGAAAPAAWQWVLPLMAAVFVISALLQHNARKALALCALAIGPVALAVIVVRVLFSTQSVFHPRYLIHAVPVWLLGLCVLRWRNALPALAIAAAICAAWLPATLAQFSNPNLQRDDVRAAVQHVVEALQPGDAIVMSRDNYAARYYDRAGRIAFSAPPGLHGVLRDPAQLLRDLNQQPLQRVRLLLWQDDVVDPQSLVEQTLRANGYQIGELNFRQIRLPLYALTRQPLQAPVFASVDTRFGDAFQLTGFNLIANPARSNWLYVNLRWQVLQKPELDYKVFVHVLDAAGNLRLQQDKLTLNALLPTHTWTAGQMFQDAYAMTLPADLPAGRYTIRVGMYDPQTGVRLRSGGSDNVMLTEFDLQR